MRREIVLILLLICGVVFAQQTANFSGHWMLTKTLPFLAANPGDVTLDIVQAGNDFVVTQTTVVDGEKTTVESKYTLDGTENVNTKSDARGRATIRSNSSWNNEILTLQGSITRNSPGGDVVNPWKTEYFLSADHAALTVRETHSTPFGDAVISQVYGK